MYFCRFRTMNIRCEGRGVFVTSGGSSVPSAILGAVFIPCKRLLHRMCRGCLRGGIESMVVSGPKVNQGSFRFLGGALQKGGVVR